MENKIRQSLSDFWKKVDDKRKQGYTDTAILDGLSSRSSFLADNIKKSRDRYSVDGKIKNDRDLVNFLAEKFSNKTPTVRSVPVKEEPTRQREDLKMIEPERKPVGERLREVSPVDVAGQTMSTMRQGIFGGLKQIGETVMGAASLPQQAGRYAAEKITGKPAPKEFQTVREMADKSKVFERKTPAERGGAMATGIAEYMIPGRASGKLGVRMLKEGAGLAGITASQKGKVDEEAGTSALIAGAFPAMGAIVKNIPFSRIGSILTNVNKDVLKRIYKNPTKIDIASKNIAENPNSPLLPIAEKVARSISSMKNSAQKSWEKSANNFREKYGEATFNFADKVPTLKSPLEKFGLTLNQLREKGKYGKDFKVVPRGKITDFTSKEIKNVQELVDDLRNAKGFTVDDIFAFRGKFDRFYNDIRLNLDGSPKKYHALIMSLKDDADKFIGAVLPKEMKQANSQYVRYNEMYKNVGSKISDASGNVKKGAEGFLSTINNRNKGEIRKQANKFRNDIGDIIGESQAIADAKKISEFFATTGSRTQDIIRSLVVSGAGFGTGGIGGAAGFGMLTSPKVIGELTKKLGKHRIKEIKEIVKSLKAILIEESTNPKDNPQIRTK